MTAKHIAQPYAPPHVSAALDRLSLQLEEDYPAAQSQPRNAPTGHPARVLAVTQLLIDVLQDLANRPPQSLSLSECDLTALLTPQLADLQRINTLARAEMSQLAPAVLAT